MMCLRVRQLGDFCSRGDPLSWMQACILWGDCSQESGPAKASYPENPPLTSLYILLLSDRGCHHSIRVDCQDQLLWEEERLIIFPGR